MISARSAPEGLEHPVLNMNTLRTAIVSGAREREGGGLRVKAERGGGRDNSVSRAPTRVARSFENRKILGAHKHFWARAAMSGLDTADEESAASKVAVRALATALVGGGRAVAAAAAGVPPLAGWVGLTLLPSAVPPKAVCAGAALGTDGIGTPRPLAVLELGDTWSAAAGRGSARAWAPAGHSAAAVGPRDLPEPRCARYVAAAAPLACGSTCVVVLGFDASGPSAEAALAAAARALAAAVAEHAGRELAAALGAILPFIADASVSAPPPLEARRGARAAARAAARASSRLTLRFADAALEARFLAWRNRQLASLDLASLLLNQGFLVFQIFIPGAFHLAAKLGTLGCSLPSLLARSELALLPPLALLRPRPREAYLRRRELVVCAMLACATFFHASVRNFVDVLDASVLTQYWPVYNFGLAHLPIMALMFQVRFLLLAPLLAALFALNAAAALPAICARYFAGEAAGACAARLAARVAPAVLVPALAGVYLLEKQARRVFLAHARPPQRPT